MMLVYISGPLGPGSLEDRAPNIDRAIGAALEVHRRGHIPVVPHLTAFMDEALQSQGIVLAYETWLTWDLVLLGRCDTLLYLGPSPGSDRERAEALRLGIPVYLDVAAIPARFLQEEGG